MAESESENGKELRSLALTPTWSVATVLTVFVAVSLLVERSIHRLSNWLRKTDRKPLLAAVEKMKEELMLLGFISLLLTATSRVISNICIHSKFYDSVFAPCTREEVEEDRENETVKSRRLLMAFMDSHSQRRFLMGLNRNTCPEPELLLSLIHFILFQNAFELASFFWFWWQFGYNSCFIRNHLLVYLRLIVGFAGQFLCSYSTLPLYALVTQMGTNYKAALIPKRIRETIHGWGKAARRKRRLGIYTDDSTIHTDTSTVISVEEDDNRSIESPRFAPHLDSQIELQPVTNIGFDSTHFPTNEVSSRMGTPLLRHSASIASPISRMILHEDIPRSSSLPH
ncbi:MLO-like protein 11 [Striga hermonthica]|uniref:MLO-like protein 11 n=1 Tax=Striga hermonthica TaxID=68872 RepID=A0A9N7MK30_STRHE|nr:MLO-like protein 11 [Striga hermonthica]